MAWYEVSAAFITLIFLAEKREMYRLDEPWGDEETLGDLQNGRICFEIFVAILVHKLKLMGFGNACVSFPRLHYTFITCWKMHFMDMGWVKVKCKNDCLVSSLVAWNDCAYNCNFSFGYFFWIQFFFVHPGDVVALVPVPQWFRELIFKISAESKSGVLQAFTQNDLGV